MSLATEKMAKRYEKTRKKLKLDVTATATGEGEEMDLFSKEREC